MGARPWLAHARHDLAAMLLARDDAGDREQALGLIADVLATYPELGMDSWTEKASGLKQALRVAPAP
jgi:hypothetical protein